MVVWIDADSGQNQKEVEKTANITEQVKNIEQRQFVRDLCFMEINVRRKKHSSRVR